VANHRNPRLTLNLLIHGGFAFAQDDRKITIYMPKGDQHVNRVGSWLAETELAGERTPGMPGTKYQLLGVSDEGTDAFDPRLNVMVKDQKVKPDLKKAFAAVEFPRPREFTSLRPVEIPRELFKVDAKAPEVELDGDDFILTASTLQVLAYDIVDQNQLRLAFQDNQEDGHYWEPIPVGNFVNLHIFCSEDRQHTADPGADFREYAELLGFPQLSVDTRFLPSYHIPTPAYLPDGVVAEETESLPLRTQRMARLGSLVRQKGDANLAWVENDALNDDPVVCYPFGGDRG
jgi:hypothetical protein